MASLYCSADPKRNSNETWHNVSSVQPDQSLSGLGLTNMSNVFLCNDLSSVSFYKICDSTPSCSENEEWYLCRFSLFGFLVQQLLSSNYSNNQQREEDKSQFWQTPNVSAKTTFSEQNTKTYYCSGKAIQCFYDIYKNKSQRYCEDGSHLDECETFQCKKAFKCPRYYCLHWRYVCDGFWDCPFGFDEVSCSNKNKPGFFHCSSSCINVMPHSVCDGIPDCPSGIDEYFCELHEARCPYSCFCLTESIFCRNQTMVTSWNHYLPHRIVYFSEFSSFQSGILHTLKNVEIFNMTNNHFPFLSLITTAPILSLKTLIVVKNDVHSVLEGCFLMFPQVTDLMLSHNSLNALLCKAFAGLRQVKRLDLSHNQLRTLVRCVLENLKNLTTLDMSSNPIVCISEDLLRNSLTSKINIYGNFTGFCCLGSNVVCSPSLALIGRPCGALLKRHQGLHVAGWLVTIATVTESLTLILWHIHGNFQPRKAPANMKDTRKAFLYLGLGVIISNGWLFCVISATCIADEHFGPGLVFQEFLWLKSLPCTGIHFFFVLHLISYPLTICFLETGRCTVVKFPFLSKFKERKFVIKGLSLLTFVSACFGILSTILYQTVSTGQKFTLCLPVGHLDTLATICAGVFVVGTPSFLFVIILMYILIVHEVKSSTSASLGSEPQDRAKKATQRGIIELSSNVLSWVPPCIFFILCMSMKSWHENQTALAWLVLLSCLLMLCSCQRFSHKHERLRF